MKIIFCVQTTNKYARSSSHRRRHVYIRRGHILTLWQYARNVAHRTPSHHRHFCRRMPSKQIYLKKKKFNMLFIYLFRKMYTHATHGPHTASWIDRERIKMYVYMLYIFYCANEYFFFFLVATSLFSLDFFFVCFLLLLVIKPNMKMCRS